MAEVRNMWLKVLQALLLTAFCTGLIWAEEFTGPRQVIVPDMNVRVDLPPGWSLRYAGPKKVQSFFINSLNGSVRSLRFTETRKEEQTDIDVAMGEYKRVQGVYSGRRDVRFQIDDRGRTKTGYYLHYTQTHPQLGVSKGFIGCTPRGQNRFLVATGEGTQARIGKRQGLKPNDQEMFEMRKVWSGIKL
jgi:hypothetical protein